jgi:hypothetical protein
MNTAGPLQALELVFLFPLELQVVFELFKSLLEMIVRDFEVVLSLRSVRGLLPMLLPQVLTHQVYQISLLLFLRDNWAFFGLEDWPLAVGDDKLLFHEDLIACETIGLSDISLRYIINDADAVKGLIRLDFMNDISAIALN